MLSHNQNNYDEKNKPGKKVFLNKKTELYWNTKNTILQTEQNKANNENYSTKYNSRVTYKNTESNNKVFISLF